MKSLVLVGVVGAKRESQCLEGVMVMRFLEMTHGLRSSSRRDPGCQLRSIEASLRSKGRPGALQWGQRRLRRRMQGWQCSAC